MGVCTKERKGVTAEVLMATPCTNSLRGVTRGESGEHKHEGERWVLLKRPRGDIDGWGEEQ